MEKRIFIAINLPEDIKRKIRKKEEEMKNLIPYELREKSVKWEKEENFHITILFIGNVNQQELPLIGKAIEKAVSGLKKIKIEGESIAFNSENPLNQKIIWLRIKNSRELSILAAKIKKEVEKEIRLPFSKNNFYPHITLGRIRKWVWKMIDPEEIPSLGEEFNFSFFSDRVDLMESKLSKKGANYYLIESFQFK